MRKRSFLVNKYTLSILGILLLLLIIDILIHKGRARVLLSSPAIDAPPAVQVQPTRNALFLKSKIWKKGVNTLEQMSALDAAVHGFEVDVYFDTLKNSLQVYHDSARFANLDITAVLDIYAARKMTAALWLDFKNLSAANQKQSLSLIAELQKKFSLQNKLIVESSSPHLLSPFAGIGIFTSYYVRLFNPYLLSKAELRKELDDIRQGLTEPGICALSGYYFQYPALKKYFPSFPILTWSEGPGASLVANWFDKKLMGDRHVAVVLYP